MSYGTAGRAAAFPPTPARQRSGRVSPPYSYLTSQWDWDDGWKGKVMRSFPGYQRHAALNTRRRAPWLPGSVVPTATGAFGIAPPQDAAAWAGVPRSMLTFVSPSPLTAPHPYFQLRSDLVGAWGLALNNYSAEDALRNVASGDIEGLKVVHRPGGDPLQTAAMTIARERRGRGVILAGNPAAPDREVIVVMTPSLNSFSVAHGAEAQWYVLVEPDGGWPSDGAVRSTPVDVLDDEGDPQRAAASVRVGALIGAGVALLALGYVVLQKGS